MLTFFFGLNDRLPSIEDVKNSRDLAETREGILGSRQCGAWSLIWNLGDVWGLGLYFIGLVTCLRTCSAGWVLEVTAPPSGARGFSSRTCRT